jgi:type IV secretory pathway VirB2 component (pilin)
MNGKFDKVASSTAAPSRSEKEIVWRMEKPGRALYVTGGLTALIPAYQGLATILAEAVICFAGTAWMFGHRTEAIERLIGAAAGLLIILQAHNIVMWLKALLA